MRALRLTEIVPQRDEPSPDRIRKWLKELDGLEATSEVLVRLATVSRKVDLLFLVVFIQRPGWFLDPDGRFGNPDWYVTLHPDVNGHVFTALLENRHAVEPTIIDIYEDRKPVSGMDELMAEREAAVRRSGYDYKRLPVSRVDVETQHLERGLRQAEAVVKPVSTRHFGELIAPGLVWKPLGEQFDLAGVGAPQRRQRLAHWLRERDYVIQPALLGALAECQWDGPVRFLLPFLHPGRGEWKHRAEGLYRGAGSLGIQINPTLRRTGLSGAEDTVSADFVISRFAERRAMRTVIDIRRPTSYKLRYAESRQRLRQQFVEGLPNHQYLLVEPAEAMQVGREWADMLTNAGASQE